MDGGGERHPAAGELLRVDQHLVRVQRVGDDEGEGRVLTVEIARVDWFDPRAVALRTAMDAETGPMYAPLLEGLDPAVLDGIAAALTVDPAAIVATILAIDDGEAVGHAALRPFGSALEVKKVFVTPERRGEGISKALMLALEDIARERGVSELVLQTGQLQVTAIALYEQLGYVRIPAFGAYVGVPFEVCFGKRLDA